MKTCADRIIKHMRMSVSLKQRHLKCFDCSIFYYNFYYNSIKVQFNLQFKMSVCRVGLLSIKNSAVFLCDLQEKFRPMIQYFPEIVEVSSRVLRAAKILDIPVVITEQYPKG